MRNLNTYKLFESAGKKVEVYHRSNDLKHMLSGRFDLSKANDEYSIFGRAIYFASSADALPLELGEYCCKFSIRLAEPVLDMNAEITFDDANRMLKDFNKKYGTTIKYYDKESAEDKTSYDFSKDYEGKVQYGEFFLELQDILSPQPNKFFDRVIRGLGYNSFKHFATFGTDFITQQGDYGFVYGVYDDKDVKFLDGPF